MDAEGWGKPSPPRVLGEHDIIREYRQRYVRYLQRRIPLALWLVGLAAIVTAFVYAQVKLVRKHLLLLVIPAALFAQPILSQLFDALRHRPYCPACELGHGTRGAKGLVCNHCGARLS